MRGVSRRGFDQLEQRLSPARSPGGADEEQRGSDRRPLPCPAGRRRDRAGEPASCWARSTAGIWRIMAGATSLAARSGPTSWPLRMQVWRCLKSLPSIGRTGRDASRCTALDQPETADFGRRARSRGGCSSGACGSSSCFRGARSAVPGGTGMVTKTMRAQPRPGGAADRSADRRLAPRPPPSRNARRHARPLHHRIRPDPVHAVGRRTSSAWGATTTSTGFRSGSPARA